MRVIYFLAWLSVSVWLAGCATIRGGGDVDQGRQALFEGNYKAALGLFQDAAQVDPNYIYGTELREGVLSYLGRAQYLNGNYAQARQTLEKALSQHKGDNVARLYLGLTLYRLGDQKDGTDEYPSRYERKLITSLITQPRPFDFRLENTGTRVEESGRA